LGKLALKNGEDSFAGFSPDGRHTVAIDFSSLFTLTSWRKRKYLFWIEGKTSLPKILAAQVNVAAFTKDSRYLVLGIKKIDGHYKSRGISIGIYDLKKRNA